MDELAKVKALEKILRQ
ncbi:hypothetical protein [Rheinheimera texasensis]